MEKRIYFRHATTSDGRRFTVAGYFDTTFDDVVVGIALCGAKENFSRSTGRNIAAGRSLSKTGTRGRSHLSLYETRMPEKYWIGQETKIFNEKINRYTKMSADQLKENFRLNR